MSSYCGVLHHYCGPQVAFEFEPSGFKKVVIVIGGLTDGLLTIAFVPTLAEALKELSYSVIQIQLTSSYKGWGTASLDTDVKEIKKLINFLKSPKGGNREKIIIMGRSTGSQDVIHYLLRHPDTVDAGILDAAVSDREGLQEDVDPQIIKRLNDHALKLIQDGHSDQLLGNEYAKYVFNTPITAYRWCSLMVPGGDDDYFSSDLSDDHIKRTFGSISKPFLVIENEKDEFVPERIDKQALLQRWESFSHPKYWSKNSGVLKEASHLVTEPAAQLHLRELVKMFIREFSL